MSAPTALDRVADVLVSAGYRRLPVPLHVAGLEFVLPAAFLGTSRSPDLILVADTNLEDEQQILRTFQNLARAMDVLQSKRPLTSVIIGDRPSLASLDAMSRVCRVLPVGPLGDADSEATLRKWLAVLMPLNLPAPSPEDADPSKAISHQLEGLRSEVASLLEVASRGPGAVEKRLHEIISESFSDIDSEDKS